MDYKVTCFFGEERSTNPSSEQIRLLKKRLTESVAKEIFKRDISWSQADNELSD